MSGTESTWQVVFRGKLLSGFTPEQVAQNLAALFKSDVARTTALLAQPKVVLKAGLSREVAERYQAALRQAGLMVALISEAPIAAGVAAATPLAPAPAPVAPTASTPMATSTTTSAADAPAATRPTAATPTLAAPGALLSDTRPTPSVEIDTSRLKLDALGVTIDTSPKPTLARDFDLSGLSVDQSGAPIAVKPKAEPPQVDLSALSVAPIDVVDKAPSEFWAKIERGG